MTLRQLLCCTQRPERAALLSGGLYPARCARAGRLCAVEPPRQPITFSPFVFTFLLSLLGKEFDQ